ncbi:MAG TPA: HNH endonuclease [Thermodesulfobacteriota bacterium]|nr:HNH endonuclease [Thermodesulfobacteriota bacterium]
MKFWVGITDNEWFDYLSRLSPEEVNFWQPSGNLKFRAIQTGGLFLFKLHSPLNYITGGGFFVSYSQLPISIAWEAFGEKNGAPSYEMLRARILKYRESSGRHELDPMIGCIVLTSPFFFTEHDWIPAPKDWRPNIVQGKTYDSSEPEGASLWSAVQERITNKTGTEHNLIAMRETTPYGSEYLIRARLGQGAFRVLVTEAYNRRCGITGERTLPALEAAHIKPYSNTGPNTTNNGLLLRSDIHRLFDLGYLTITNDFHVEVSKRIKEEYENGREYYAFHGKELKVPSKLADYPSRDYIEWHNQNIYVP